VGYRWYDAHSLTSAYPFGLGLSYTSFRYSGLSITPDTPASQDIATATVTVTNTGSRTGTAVPQLYLSKPSTTALPQPARQLEPSRFSCRLLVGGGHRVVDRWCVVKPRAAGDLIARGVGRQ